MRRPNHHGRSLSTERDHESCICMCVCLCVFDQEWSVRLERWWTMPHKSEVTEHGGGSWRSWPANRSLCTGIGSKQLPNHPVACFFPKFPSGELELNSFCRWSESLEESGRVVLGNVLFSTNSLFFKIQWFPSLLISVSSCRNCWPDTRLLWRTLACVHPKHFSVYIQNVSVCTGNTPTCVLKMRTCFLCTRERLKKKHTEVSWIYTRRFFQHATPHTTPHETAHDTTTHTQNRRHTRWNTTHARTCGVVTGLTVCPKTIAMFCCIAAPIAAPFLSPLLLLCASCCFDVPCLALLPLLLFFFFYVAALCCWFAAAVDVAVAAAVAASITASFCGNRDRAALADGSVAAAEAAIFTVVLTDSAATHVVVVSAAAASAVAAVVPLLLPLLALLLLLLPLLPLPPLYVLLLILLLTPLVPVTLFVLLFCKYCSFSMDEQCNNSEKTCSDLSKTEASGRSSITLWRVTTRRLFTRTDWAWPKRISTFWREMFLSRMTIVRLLWSNRGLIVSSVFAFILWRQLESLFHLSFQKLAVRIAFDFYMSLCAWSSFLFGLLILHGACHSSKIRIFIIICESRIQTKKQVTDGSAVHPSYEIYFYVLDSYVQWGTLARITNLRRLR